MGREKKEEVQSHKETAEDAAQASWASGSKGNQTM